MEYAKVDFTLRTVGITLDFTHLIFLNIRIFEYLWKLKDVLFEEINRAYFRLRQRKQKELLTYLCC